MSEAIIRVRGIIKRFRRNVVLDGVDLDVAQGSVTALLGRNGEGKSTLLKILVGFMMPTSGEVSVFGIDPTRKGPKVRGLVGYVPDQLELPKWMTVDEHFRFLEPFYPTWDREEEARLVERLGLDRRAKISSLSKGFRTKQLLAAALAHQPQLLLLDEPFSGLDPVVREDVLSTVLGHLKDAGRTVVLVSHSLTDVERVADTVVFLDGGKIVRSGDLEEMQRSFVRLAVTVVGDGAWTPPGSPSVVRNGPDLLLTYTDWREEYDTALKSDDRVSSVRRLGRDLGDVFVATTKGKEEPCNTSVR